MTTRWKIALYGFLSAGAIVLASLIVFLFYPDPFINAVIKGRITEAFRDAYPDYSIQIGNMHYDIRENRVGFDSVSLMTVDSTLSGTIAAYSVSGIGWFELLWARGLVLNGFTGTVLEARGIVVNFQREQYELRCGLLHVSVPDSEIVVDTLTIHPSGDDEQFFAGSRFRRTRFQAVVPHARVSGLACLEMLQGKMYIARAAEISDPSIDVLINKNKPAARDTSGPRMPNEILSSIKETIQIDSLNIRNGNLKYGERFMVGSKPALLTFDSMQVVITGIANNGADGDTMVIHAEGQFVKSAKMSVGMSIPVSSPEFSMRYSGSLSRLDLRRLNDWLGPSDQTRVKSGILQGATFDINVSSGRAGGSVRASYRDLTLAVINKNTGSEGGFVDGIASFVANTFKIRGTNVPDESGAMKIGLVKYARKQDDPFFGFTWFALRSGVGDVVGF